MSNKAWDEALSAELTGLARLLMSGLSNAGKCMQALAAIVAENRVFFIDGHIDRSAGVTTGVEQKSRRCLRRLQGKVFTAVCPALLESHSHDLQAQLYEQRHRQQISNFMQGSL
ncbi:MAG: hypothetical protein WA071_28255 [Undibacterium umbellatum]|uniref:hypothetical protein n=1 Tax=Undibacterium umbellatum TaxID=2762300 RepID=UPI003BB5ADB9